MKNKKATPIESSPKQSKANSKPKEPGKERSMLMRFASGERHHRFSAECLGDHCLPTTISDLQRTHGLYFSRQRVKTRNRFGSTTPVMRYWLEGTDLARARKIVGLKEVAA